MHHTVNEIPVKNIKRYDWEKKHLENRTGTKDSYKPNKISKSSIKKKYESWNE